jgi:hypothetical protein
MSLIESLDRSAADALLLPLPLTNGRLTPASHRRPDAPLGP